MFLLAILPNVYQLHRKANLSMATKKFRRYTLDELAKATTISVEEASHLLGISRTSAYEASKRGEISCVKIGKHFRVLAQPLYQILTGGQYILDRSN